MKMDEKQLFSTLSCEDFDDFVGKAKTLLDRSDAKGEAWVFRGQQSADWVLSTSFERECIRFGVRSGKRPLVEDEMVREFQRRLHHYTSNVPDTASTDEWLALMQHHGAPTRLLDVTYSPYVAAYFAFEHSEPDSYVAVWCLESAWFEEWEQLNGWLAACHQAYRENRQGREFDDVFMAAPNKLVLAANPLRLNERLAYQKGAFLCPGDIRVGFMDNLSAYASKEELRKRVIRYRIPTGLAGKERDRALKELDRMNISRTTLFPGLDGFAQSLSVKIATVFKAKVEADNR